MSPARMERVEAALRLAIEATRLWNGRDAAALAALLAEDAYFEWPTPERTVGSASGRNGISVALERLFSAGTAPTITPIEAFGTPLRAVVRWKGGDGAEGADIYAIRNDRIAERVSYVNGKGDGR